MLYSETEEAGKAWANACDLLVARAHEAGATFASHQLVTRAGDTENTDVVWEAWVAPTNDVAEAPIYPIARLSRSGIGSLSYWLKVEIIEAP
jgi:hypothetical protein